MAQTYPMESDELIANIPGLYFKDTNNNLDKFEGTWVYEDTNSKLKVVLKKVDDYEYAGFFSDVILGNYIYEENGVEVINTLTNPAVSQGSDDIYHIEMYGFKNSSKLVGDFEDPIRSKWTNYTLYLTQEEITRPMNTQQTLLWNVRIYSFYNPQGDPDARQERRVPSLLTLIKVE